MIVGCLSDSKLVANLAACTYKGISWANSILNYNSFSFQIQLTFYSLCVKMGLLVCNFNSRPCLVPSPGSIKLLKQAACTAPKQAITQRCRTATTEKSGILRRKSLITQATPRNRISRQ